MDDIKIVRAHRKTLALQVLSDGTIEVKAPFLIPGFMIRQFVKKNHDWIEQKKSLLAKKKGMEKTYQDGEAFLFLGNTYRFSTGNYSSIEIKDDKLLFPMALLFRAKKEIENWYIAQAKAIITKQTIVFAKEMKTDFVNITFSDTKSQWGRCTYDNRLQFSWRLVMTPLLVLNYVVVHELAHTMEKNHSITFWRIVRSVMPSYRQQVKWLKTNGNTLVV